MTSSSEPRVIRRVDASTATPLPTPDLRSATWTRSAAGSVIGDVVTESTLGVLAERARATAEAQGYAVGWASGAREAAAATQRDRDELSSRASHTEHLRRAEHEAAVAALAQAAELLAQATARACALVGAQAVELALGVTESVLGAATAAALPRDVVARAVDVLPERGLVRVRLHPDVLRLVSPADLPATVAFEADATLGPADALVEVDDALVDLRVGTALRRVREALA